MYIKGCPFYVYFYSEDVHNVRKRLVNKLFILLSCLFIFIKYGDYFIHTHIYIYIYIYIYELIQLPDSF